MTPLPSVWVYPSVGPRFFHVHRDSVGITGAYAGLDPLDLWREPAAARCESYYLGDGAQCEHWRPATPDEVVLALWSLMLEEHESPELGVG